MARDVEKDAHAEEGLVWSNASGQLGEIAVETAETALNSAGARHGVERVIQVGRR